jgi:hypothetical protein
VCIFIIVELYSVLVSVPVRPGQLEDALALNPENRGVIAMSNLYFKSRILKEKTG